MTTDQDSSLSALLEQYAGQVRGEKAQRAFRAEFLTLCFEVRDRLRDSLQKLDEANPSLPQVLRAQLDRLRVSFDQVADDSNQSEMISLVVVQDDTVVTEHQSTPTEYWGDSGTKTSQATRDTIVLSNRPKSLEPSALIPTPILQQLQRLLEDAERPEAQRSLLQDLDAVIEAMISSFPRLDLTRILWHLEQFGMDFEDEEECSDHLTVESVQVLGHGGMGAVIRVQGQTEAGEPRTFAVKVPFVHNNEQIADFQAREIGLMKTWHNEAFNDDERFAKYRGQAHLKVGATQYQCGLMSYYRGITLDKLKLLLPYLNPRISLELGLCLFETMEVIQMRSFIYGDLKPENVIFRTSVKGLREALEEFSQLSHKDRVSRAAELQNSSLLAQLMAPEVPLVLIDFGAVRDIHGQHIEEIHDENEQIIGGYTPAYMNDGALQYEGVEAFNSLSDRYAAAVTMLELLTGYPAKAFRKKRDYCLSTFISYAFKDHPQHGVVQLQARKIRQQLRSLKAIGQVLSQMLFSLDCSHIPLSYFGKQLKSVTGASQVEFVKEYYAVKDRLEELVALLIKTVKNKEDEDTETLTYSLEGIFRDPMRLAAVQFCLSVLSDPLENRPHVNSEFELALTRIRIKQIRELLELSKVKTLRKTTSIWQRFKSSITGRY